MIFVKLIGGLGNQLFQYAAGRRLAHHHQTELKLDISAYETYTLRQYALKYFNIIENIASSKEIQRYHQPPWKRLADGLKKYSRRSVIRERTLRFDPRVLELPDNVCLQGYWASERYFKDIESIVHREFTLRFPMSATAQAITRAITQSNAVSIHIRRGDYAQNEHTREVHGLCPLEYYRTASDLMARQVGNFSLFVFTDDIAWAKEHFILPYPTTFVSGQPGLTDHEELILHSNCQHHIIANSTFSWWGAWLSGNPNKIVIAPKRWFRDPSLSAADLLPPSWITL